MVDPMSPKADMSENGLGRYIINMNEETLRIQNLWHVLEEHYWVFGLYAALLLGIYAALGIFVFGSFTELFVG